MVILGIDPGSRVTGFGVISLDSHKQVKHLSHGVILMNADESFPERMKGLGNSLDQILKKYCPDQMVIEKIFLGKNADSAFKLGHARGVAIYKAAQYNCKVFEYATRVIKKGIVGNGAASKEDVQNCLQKLLNLKAISRLDASDALALAVFHGFQEMNPLRQLQTRGHDFNL